jgi:hypothetical protein
MHPNVIQHESNDGLVINQQNRIFYVTYISKMLDATHAMQPDILLATITMAQLAKNLLQENLPGVKRILRYLKRTIDFALTCGGQGGLETRAHISMEFKETTDHSAAYQCLMAETK